MPTVSLAALAPSARPAPIRKVLRSMLPPGYKSSYIMDGMQVVLNEIDADTRIVLYPRRIQSAREFLHFCEIHPSLKIERNTQGEIAVTIKAPADVETPNRNATVLHQLRAWAKRDGRGKVFGSNTLFMLPTGAVLSSPASWILQSRLDPVTAARKKPKILEICPDFVVELV